MYNSSGNYEVFAYPQGPGNVEHKYVYIVGTGFAALSVACHLVRDARMHGSHIHIFEKNSIPGGACNGFQYASNCYRMYSGWEMDRHCTVLRNVLRSISSSKSKGLHVLDDCDWLKQKDPAVFRIRIIQNRGKRIDDDRKFDLSDQAIFEIAQLFVTPDEELQGKTVTDFFDEEVFQSNFWLYCRSVFAFSNWHSALELKRYLHRYLHYLNTVDSDGSQSIQYNPYESLILPMVRDLKEAGVQFHYDANVIHVDFDIQPHQKSVRHLTLQIEGEEEVLDLREDDLVFLPLGNCMENPAFGDQNTPAQLDSEFKSKGGWTLWKQIAEQDASFGHPEMFCSNPEKTSWVSATATMLDDRIPSYIQKFFSRDFISRGGEAVVQDSNWLIRFRWQSHTPNQPKGQPICNICGLTPNQPGNFVKKPMRDCSGREICMEWLYHLGVPENQIEEWAANSASTIPCILPYFTAALAPRSRGDRPDIVPEGAVNFAFIGQFAELAQDATFTAEYAMRTGVEAVNTLLHMNWDIPEVWDSMYDVRCLLNAIVKLRDGKKITDMDQTLRESLGELYHTKMEELLREYHVI